jgi:glycosyltransferase involved in cell wall biosynthesis
MKTGLSSLYVSYLSLSDPLVETQVVSYLTGLVAEGHEIHLLTYETGRLSPRTIAERRSRLGRNGITWHWLRYHKSPSVPATLYDVVRGAVKAIRLIRRHEIDVVHARAHVPAAMALIAMRLTGVRLIFDIRGLMAEEYVDSGRWKADSMRVRLTKAVERRAISRASAAVVLTHAARELLFDSRPTPAVEVIPCCVDLARFEALAREPAPRIASGFEGKTVMAYVGKFGGWYMQREMVEFFQTAAGLIPRLHFLILSQSDRSLIDREFARCGVTPDAYTVATVLPDEVASLLSSADFAISFIRQLPSKVASSPTKIGEYLAAGLPVVSTPGIGDSDAILRGSRTGIFVRDMSSEAFREAIDELGELMGDWETGQRCRAAARKYLSLQHVGIPRYAELYRNVADGL